MTTTTAPATTTESAVAAIELLNSIRECLVAIENDCNRLQCVIPADNYKARDEDDELGQVSAAMPELFHKLDDLYYALVLDERG